MEDYQPLPTSKNDERQDQDIWNLAGMYPPVYKLSEAYKLLMVIAPSMDIVDAEGKVRAALIMLETKIYDILAAKHDKPSEEIAYLPDAYSDDMIAWERFAFRYLPLTDESPEVNVR